MIKEFIQKIQSGDCNSTEITLTGICLILFGIVIGMLIAPIRFSVIQRWILNYQAVWFSLPSNIHGNTEKLH